MMYSMNYLKICITNIFNKVICDTHLHLIIKIMLFINRKYE